MVQRLNDEHATLLQHVEETKQKLQQEREDRESLAKSLNQAQLPEHVRLNVGGERFATSRANLQRYENSFFSALFSGRWETNLEEEIFIDRSPLLFGRVIDFLRGDQTVAEDLNEMDRERLANEADFYQLHGLMKVCQYFEPVRGTMEIMAEKKRVKRTLGFARQQQYSQQLYGQQRYGQQLYDQLPCNALDVAVIRPKIYIPLRRASFELSLRITDAAGGRDSDIFIGLCPEIDLAKLFVNHTLEVSHGVFLPIAEKIGMNQLENQQIITIRLLDDLKVQWTLTKMSAETPEEVLIKEKHLNLGSSPLVFVVCFHNSSGEIELY